VQPSGCTEVLAGHLRSVLIDQVPREVPAESHEPSVGAHRPHLPSARGGLGQQLSAVGNSVAAGLELEALLCNSGRGRRSSEEDTKAGGDEAEERADDQVQGRTLAVGTVGRY
jgi:hypothetical protein